MTSNKYHVASCTAEAAGRHSGHTGLTNSLYGSLQSQQQARPCVSLQQFSLRSAWFLGTD